MEMGSEGRTEPSPDAQMNQEAEKPNSAANVSDAPPPPVGDVASDEMGAETVSLKRRGRPRKSGDGPMALAVVPPPGFTTPVEKRGRGRPKGSTNKTKQLIASSTYESSAGKDFVAHLLCVRPGEDIVTRISFLCNEIGARSLFVISALGSVSSSILSQPGSQVGIMRNGCDCGIQALSGTYTCSETGGVYHKQGILSAVLTKPDGEVIGGRVAGPLIASSSVQLVMGSFQQVNLKK